MNQRITQRLILLGVIGITMAAMAPAAMAKTKAPTNVTCPEFNPSDQTDSSVFQGTAKNLVVPAGHFCVIWGADVTKNVTVESGGFFGASNSTIGHDLVSHGALVIETGAYYTPGGKGPGPVTVGRDVILSGSSDNLDFCDTTVVRNFVANGLHNAFELQLGDTSERDLDYTNNFDSCQGEAEGKRISQSPKVTINRDLIITNSTFGLLDVANDSIGRNLTVSNDVATYETEGYLPAGQGMWVNNNTVGRNANCLSDTPALASAGPDAGPNTVGAVNNCKF